MEIAKKEIAKKLPHIDWTYAGLEKAGVPQQLILNILYEFDQLDIWHGSNAEEDMISVSKRGISGFKGLERYVSLHYLVSFCESNTEAPFELLEIAAALTAKGILGLNNGLKAKGCDIVRYQIWRGHSHVEAYFKSLQRFRGTKRQKERLMEQLEPFLKPV